jgi:hypothetical protein
LKTVNSRQGGGVDLPDSEWLKDYYGRIRDEYKFSMERKDRLFDWAIGILFVAIVAYTGMLTNNQPSIWRVYLLVGLSCFIMRLFTNSCLAYSYLKKWKYLMDLIEKHWMYKKTTIENVQKEIEKYHYKSRTTKKRTYFIKHQLVGGFLLLFVFPFVLIFSEYSTYPPQNLMDILPLLILVVYYAYETYIMCAPTHRSRPPDRQHIQPLSTNKP